MKKYKCIRCKSTKIERRLSGDTFCKKCGQRFKINGELIPSSDRRKFKNNKEIII